VEVASGEAASWEAVTTGWGVSTATGVAVGEGFGVSVVGGEDGVEVGRAGVAVDTEGGVGKGSFVSTGASVPVGREPQAVTMVIVMSRVAMVEYFICDLAHRVEFSFLYFKRWVKPGSKTWPHPES